ncbi:hypothetical protein [Paenibacillus thailandensis]|uniref:Uncharacterized protein n=1 Tax=Paenibacillus thailandensis TaxID=393250 RepID=A0ABW5R5H6_9BACL
MKALFEGELCDYTEHEDGSKTIFIAKNKDGFKITLHVSGDPEEHKKGIQAVKDFFVNSH